MKTIFSALQIVFFIMFVTGAVRTASILMETLGLFGVSKININDYTSEEKEAKISSVLRHWIITAIIFLITCLIWDLMK